MERASAGVGVEIGAGAGIFVARIVPQIIPVTPIAPADAATAIAIPAGTPIGPDPEAQAKNIPRPATQPVVVKH